MHNYFEIYVKIDIIMNKVKYIVDCLVGPVLGVKDCQ